MSELDVVTGWARKTLVNENDMIYMRLKDGVITWINANQMNGGVKGSGWTQLDPNEVPNSVSNPMLVGPDAPSPEALEFAAKLEQVPSGWYQDTASELYKYLGGGDWDSVDSNTKKKKLNQELVSGQLDYLG